MSFAFEKTPALATATTVCFMKMVYWDRVEKEHLSKGSWNKERNWD